MQEIDKQAVAEVIEVLNHSDSEITNKIPEKFMKFLHDNSDNEFKVNIDFTNEHWDETIKQDTRIILALIYRDFLVSKEEREVLLKQEQDNLNKEEQELREKYNPDNLFNKKSDQEEKDNKTANDMQLIEVKEDSWFKKIWKKIMSFFGKKQ